MGYPVVHFEINTASQSDLARFYEEAFAADPAAADRAARLRGAVAQLNSDADVVMNAYFRATDELERHFERELVAALGEEAWEQEKTAGSTMTLEQAIELGRSLSGDSERVVAAES